MTDSLKDELIVANQILVQRDILDAFGHISVRHPFITYHFLLSSVQAPILVQADDILEFNLDSTLGEATKVPL